MLKILLLLSGFCLVRAENFVSIDAHALSAPPAAERSVADLAAYFGTAAVTDTEKVRAVYRWITAKIEYDVEGFLSGRYGDAGPRAVLRTRKSICQGYAWLFHQLAASLGLEAVTISGYSKGYGVNAGQKFTTGTNHAWNAVKIDGTWQLIDCTWGAGYMNAANTYIKRFNPHYFLTPPRKFIFDHLPEDPRWQLLDKPLSLEEYEELVFLRPAYFRLGLDIGAFSRNTICVSRRMKLPVISPPDVLMSAELIKGDAVLGDEYLFVQREESLTVIHGLFPEPGTYTLRLYGKRTEEEGPFTWVADYRIDAAEAGGAEYPEVYTVFHKRTCRLYTPLTAGLKAGKKQMFRVRIPGAEQAAVVCGEKWLFFRQAGPDFSGLFTPARGPVQICAKFPGKKSFSVLLEYEAR